MNILEFDAALERRNWLGRRKIFPFRFQIDEAEEAFGARHGGQGLVVLVANDLDRLEEKIRQKKEHHEIAHVHVHPSVPLQRTVAANECHCAEEKLAFHLQQRNENGGSLSDADVVFAVNVYQLAEKACIDLLADERLLDANTIDRFRKARRDATLRILN